MHRRTHENTQSRTMGGDIKTGVSHSVVKRDEICCAPRRSVLRHRRTPRTYIHTGILYARYERRNQLLFVNSELAISAIRILLMSAIQLSDILAIRINDFDNLNCSYR